MRAISSKFLIFGSLRGAFFMDVRASETGKRETARASRTGKAEKPEGEAVRARTGKVEKPEEGCAACGREKLRNRRKAVRARTGKADKQKGSRATNEQGKVDNGVQGGRRQQQLRWITCRQH